MSAAEKLIHKNSQVLEQDNTPTPERQEKPDYVTVSENPRKRRRSDTLDILFTKKWIGGNEIEEADRWVKDHLLGHGGYCDAMKLRSAGYEPGDRITFGISQGKALERIARFKSFAGPRSHGMLWFALAEGWSFSSLGKVFFSQHGKNKQIEKAMTMLAETLTALSEFWIEQRKLEKQRREQIN